MSEIDRFASKNHHHCCAPKPRSFRRALLFLFASARARRRRRARGCRRVEAPSLFCGREWRQGRMEMDDRRFFSNCGEAREVFFFCVLLLLFFYIEALFVFLIHACCCCAICWRRGGGRRKGGWCCLVCWGLQNLKRKRKRAGGGRGREGGGGCRRRSLLFFFSLRRRRRCRILSRSLARVLSYRWGGWCCFKKKGGVVLLVVGGSAKNSGRRGLFFLFGESGEGCFRPSCSSHPLFHSFRHAVFSLSGSSFQLHLDRHGTPRSGALSWD